MNRLTWIQIGIAVISIIAILIFVYSCLSYFGWIGFSSTYLEPIPLILGIGFSCFLLGASIVSLIVIAQLKKFVNYKQRQVTETQQESAVEYQPINIVRELFLWHFLLGPSTAPMIINEAPIYEGDTFVEETTIIQEPIEEPVETESQITESQIEVEPEIEIDTDFDFGDFF